MTALRRFVRLPLGEQALLLRAFTAVLAARLRLLFGASPLTFALPCRRVLPAPVARSHPPARFAWAVRHASRLLPGTKCLAQALALHELLQQDGHTSVVRIGVTKDFEKGFQAHAWVEYPGGPLLNTPAELAQYSPLASFPGGAQ